MPEPKTNPREEAPPVVVARGSLSADGSVGCGAADLLVDFSSPPLWGVLVKLLQDKTTGLAIRLDWAPGSLLSTEWLLAHRDSVRPRVEKSRDAQKSRTKAAAEVFTPSGLCRRMIAVIDEDFAQSRGDDAPSSRRRIPVWQRFVDSRRLEITCGEAPFVVQRYDAATGAPIPREYRGGMLDAKLRAVDENAADDAEWWKWTLRAFESVYGYELAGDSLLIARANLVLAFSDAVRARFGREPTERELGRVANVVAWNFWQMDWLFFDTEAEAPPPDLPGMGGAWWGCGLRAASGKGRPAGAPLHEQVLFSFGDISNGVTNSSSPHRLDGGLETAAPPRRIRCRIFDWRARKPVVFSSLLHRTENAKTMKFDYIIGNPPYQADVENAGDRAPPLYHRFMDAVYNVSDKVCLVTPGRFLFNAGQTPKAWNEKMLSDPHLRVVEYTQKSGEVFANTDIKGGVVVTYHDKSREIGPIGAFSAFQELNSILHKVLGFERGKSMFDTIVSSQGIYRFSQKFLLDNPEIAFSLGNKGTGTKIVSKEFETMPDVFLPTRPKNGKYFEIVGRLESSRVSRFIKCDWLDKCSYLDKFNVLIPEANGTGTIGEVLSTPMIGEPMIGEPMIGSTDTFISVGRFSAFNEAENCLKYVKTKFARTMLGALKATQHNPKSTWRYVPLQDFTPSSDIDWSKSVAEIDRQLYAKYGLDDREIDFIETHVKEMK